MNDLSGNIESARIYFRDLRVEDIDTGYYQWINDSQVNQFLESRFKPLTHSDLVEYINTVNLDMSSIIFAIVDKKNDKHIGNIKLGPINWVHRYADVGIVIGPREYWGKGYASESIKLLMEYAFKRINLRRLTAGMYMSNIGSKKAFEKCGFIQEGIRREHVFFNGKYEDVIQLAYINDTNK